jgi:hypothetical protein
MQYSAVLIIPAALKTHADAVGEAMGWGPVSYTIPLGNGETVTHYGARADVSTQFVRWLRGDEPLPDPAFQAIMAGLIADFSPDPVPNDYSLPAIWGNAHMTRAIDSAGLIRMDGSA